MVRYRYQDSVEIQVTGPKSFLPVPKTVIGRLNMTWIHFLNGTCGLRMDADSDYFICTSTYTTTNPGSGWTADLNDQIKTFIEKYSRKRSKYCVRIHTGSPPSDDSEASNEAATDDASDSEENTSKSNGNSHSFSNSSAWKPSILRKPLIGPVRKFAGVIPIKPSAFASHQNGRAGEVFVQPTPPIIIPSRLGGQLGHGITPIQPVLPQKLQRKKSRSPPVSNNSVGNGNDTASTSSPSQETASSGINRKRPIIGPASKTGRGSAEVSMHVGAGTSNGRARAQEEPSPPKLTRFDAPEPPVVNQDADDAKARDRRSMPPPPPPPIPSPKQTSTSRARLSAPVTARVPASPRNTRQHRVVRQPPRRYEEDSFVGRIISVSGRDDGVNIEPRPIQVNFDGEEVNNEDNNNQDNFQFIDESLSEAEIFNRLGIEDDYVEEDNGGMGFNNDNLSMCTAVSAEERELRRSGIQVQNIKDSIERKMDRFDNSMLKRIQREIKKLKQNNEWDRNVRRAPLACYLLSELFKEQN